MIQARWQSFWKFLGLLVVCNAIMTGFENSASAQIVPDNTLGNEKSQVTNNPNIRGLPAQLIEGGAIRGVNLFQSFSQFNVGDGERVYFANPTGIQNILSRVTGNDLSKIFGTLGVNGNANLFLINPNGIIFGQNARLDVAGSFVGTTANAIGFGQNGFFSASSPQAPSQLLTVNPSVFFFNQINQNAAIQNNSVASAGKDPAGFDAFGLRVLDGKSLLFVGGNVSIDGGWLNAFGGRVELGGLAEPGSVNLVLDENNFRLGFPENVTRADVSLANQARVSVNGVDGGNIAVNARNLDISGESGFFAGIRFGLGTPNSKGGNIAINATETVNLTENSFIYNTLQITATGKAGDIIINTGSANLESGSVLSVSTYGKGDAGNIFITATDGVSLKGRGTEIFNDVEPGAVGNGGEINIKAGSLTLSERGQIEASVISGDTNRAAGRGNAGNVNIDVRGRASFIGVSDEPLDSYNTAIFNTLDNGSIGAGGNINIKANAVLLRDRAQLGTSTFGQGNAGDIFIQASESVFLDNAYISSLVGRGGVGNSGNIFINSGTLTLNNGALLQTSVRNTFNNQPAGRGNAGNIKVDLRDAVTISDDGSGIFSIIGNGAIGNGGDINIKAGSLFVNNEGELSASSFGQGDAGNIFIEGRDRISFNNGFATSIIGTNAQGKGGNINLSANILDVTNNGSLITSTFGRGNAGSVILEARENVLFNGANAFSSVESGGVGDGSNISIKAGVLTLSNGAQLQTVVREASNTQPAGRGNAGQINVDVRDAVTISASGSGLNSFVSNGAIGNGGDINIKAGSLFLSDDADITANTYGQGNAGNITVRASDSVTLTNARIFSTVDSGGVGNGGNIDINASSLSLFDSAQLITSVRKADENLPPGQGNAGNVNVNVTGAVTISGIRNDFASGIFTNVETGVIGNGGNVTISSGSLLLSDKAKLLANTSGQGNAGNISIRASDSIFVNDAFIFSTVEPGGVGNGGNLEINAASLSLTDNAQLLTLVREADDNLSAGRGNAGNININVTGTVAIAGSKNGGISGIGSEVERGAIGNGGNITISSGSLFFHSGTQLSSSTSGQGDAGSVFLRAKDSVSLAGQARILSTVEAVGKGGNIEINATSLSLQDSALLISSTYGEGSAGNVIINVRENVLFDGADAVSTVEAGGVGNGGNISVKAGNLTLSKSSLQTLVRSAYDNRSAGRGNAGQIDIDVRDAINISGTARLYSLAQDGAIGNGGNINVKTGSLFVSDGAEIIASMLGKGFAGNIIIDARENVQFDKASAFSTVGYTGEGNGGNINIKAGSLFFTNGAEIATSTFGIGSAGNVILNARENILFDKGSAFSSVNQNAIGNGGDIRISTGSFSAINSAALQASTFGRGNAGNIIIDARDTVSFDRDSSANSQIRPGGVGKGGDIRITTDFLSLTNGSLLTASTFAQGDAGNIQIQASESIKITGSSTVDDFGSGIFSTTWENSTGKGGNITVDTKNFRLSEGALLSTRTRTDSKGGNITLNTSAFEALNGGQVLTTTSSSGSAGTITVNATKRVTISGSDATFNDRIAKFPDILNDIDATANNSGFFVSSTGSGTTGDIFVTSPKITLDNGGRFIAESASGNGGNINLQVSDLLLMRRGAQISTSAGTAQQGGDGGNINLNSQFLVAIPQENSDIIANAFTGSGGKVTINTSGIYGFQPLTGAQLRILNTNSNPRELLTNDISAVSQQGGPQLDGQITVNNPDVDPSNGLAFLPADVFDPSNQIAQGCSAFDQANASDFKVSGRGGLPPSPDETLSSDAVWEDTRLLATTAQRLDSKTTATKPKSESDIVEIVPATGWVFNGKGEVTLVSQTPNTTAETLAASSQSCRVR